MGSFTLEMDESNAIKIPIGLNAPNSFHTNFKDSLDLKMEMQIKSYFSRRHVE